MNERRQELEAAARSSIRDEEDRNAVFELACFTPQTFLAHGCKAGARVCLLLADGRPARLPPGVFPSTHPVAYRTEWKLVAETQGSQLRQLAIYHLHTPRPITITLLINRPLLDQ